jgi:K+-transporting ATPase ATPase C chain
MRTQLRPALAIFFSLVLLTGIVYPLMITGISQLLFPRQAEGSLLTSNGQVAGSRLIGQFFSGDQYFWGRPSSTAGYPDTALNLSSMSGSSGSNLGPLSKSLIDTVQQRVKALQAADPGNLLPIPVDLVTASASGLDADISLAAAYYQVPRVARARGMKESDVRNLIDQYAEGRMLGFLGEPRVNVLWLNLALDGIQ